MRNSWKKGDVANSHGLHLGAHDGDDVWRKFLFQIGAFAMMDSPTPNWHRFSSARISHGLHGDFQIFHRRLPISR